ncbi:MAB_1171c family putative transporter [Gandjariella thermophila]|uniref:MAB_1171c family putative transporter n=1 Tax=Gandjariella thermophila TaxID=1931992 RepID=UPI0010FA3F73|nr:MAB_1171c family putative transporter [Gandjariella thermophila]
MTLAWFLYRLVRTPRDAGLYAIVVCLIIQLLTIPEVIFKIQSITGWTAVPTLKLIVNYSLTVSLYLMMLFFLLSAGGGLRRAVIEGAVVLSVCAGMTIAMFTTPEPVQAQAYSGVGGLPENMSVTGLAPFFLLGNAYISYMSIQIARLALRYAEEANPRGRIGLRIAAVGLFCYFLTAVVRCVATVVRWAGHPGFGVHLVALINEGAPAGTAVFLVGVSYVGLAARLAALRTWLRHWRVHDELWPLWHQLNIAFPNDALQSAPKHRWVNRWSPMHVHRRWWRRLVECRDGLVQLSPQLVEAGLDHGRPIHEQVECVRTALRRQTHGHQPASRSAVLVAAPDTDELDSDEQQLVRLSQALAQEGKP